jgi:hypothetical protein
MLRFETKGYVVEFLGERHVPGGMYLTEVTPGADKASNIVMRLTPTGTIRGWVHDDKGQSMTDVPIHLLQQTYSLNGGKVFYRVGPDDVRTNSRGEYGFSDIEPGHYVVSAKKVGQSEVVDVGPAADVTGIDFTVHSTTFRVRGRVIDEKTGKPPRSAVITGDLTDLMSPIRALEPRNNYDPETGNFELVATPGEHVIGAQVDGSPCDAERSARDGLNYFNADGPAILSAGGSTKVRVENADVEGVVITIRSAGCLTGEVRTDGAPMPGFWLELNTAEGLQVHPNTVHRDQLTIDGLMPGEYRISRFSHPRGFYVKSATFNGSNVLDQTFQFNTSIVARLKILLSSRVAEVEGKVVNESLQPASNVYVVLVPDKMRGRSERYSVVVTQEDGSFSVPSVAPGDYKAFAWESIETYSWMDPEVLRRYESKGKLFHVDESSKAVIDLRVIR